MIKRGLETLALSTAIALSPAAVRVAEAGPFGDISYARQALTEDTARACGEARVGAAEHRRARRLAEFDYARSGDDGDLRRLLEIDENWRVRQQEIIADLQEDTFEQSDILGRRAMGVLSSNAPVFIAQCARSGE